MPKLFQGRWRPASFFALRPEGLKGGAQVSFVIQSSIAAVMSAGLSS